MKFSDCPKLNDCDGLKREFKAYQNFCCLLHSYRNQIARPENNLLWKPTKMCVEQYTTMRGNGMNEITRESNQMPVNSTWYVPDNWRSIHIHVVYFIFPAKKFPSLSIYQSLLWFSWVDCMLFTVCAAWFQWEMRVNKK